MKFKQFRPNPFARSIYLHSQITMWGFAWHSQGLGVCRRNSARLTAAPREKTKTRTRSQIISEEKGVCVCVCVCALREVCVSGGRGRVPVSLSGVQFSGEVRVHVVYQGPRLPAAGASRRRWPPPCSSRWSRRRAAPSRYSASPAHTQPETHTHTHTRTHTHTHIQSEAWTWSFTNTVTSG